jgi:hypothetical protein
MLASRQITSINFADTFAHSPFSVSDRVKNIAHILVEAFVTQCLTSHRQTRGLAALAGCAGAASRFLQAIEPTHRLGLFGRTGEKSTVLGHELLCLFDFQVASMAAEIRDGRCATIHTA